MGLESQIFCLDDRRLTLELESVKWSLPCSGAIFKNKNRVEVE